MKICHVFLISFLLVGETTAQPRTYLYVNGDAGETVSRGRTVAYTGSDLDTNATVITCQHRQYGDGGVLVDYVIFDLMFTNDCIPGPLPGDNWKLQFGTHKIPTNIVAGDYPQAQRAAFASPGHPGIDITCDNFGFNAVTGSYTIIAADFDYSGAVPKCRSFAAVFTMAGIDWTMRWLRGTLLYNFDGDLRPPQITSVAFSGGAPVLEMKSLMPGFNVRVERTSDLSQGWESNAQFACTDLSTNFTDSTTNTMDRAFYRLTTH